MTSKVDLGRDMYKTHNAYVNNVYKLTHIHMHQNENYHWTNGELYDNA